MIESGWKLLTWKRNADYIAFRSATAKYLQETLPALTDNDFNWQDGIEWSEEGYSQCISAPSLALNPPSREMPGLVVGTYFIFVQTTKILPEQIQEITSLVSDFGYASIWVLGDTADTTDNRAAALVCDDHLIPSLLVGDKDSFGCWSVVSNQSESLLEAATQTAERRRSYWQKIDYFSSLVPMS